MNLKFPKFKDVNLEKFSYNYLVRVYTEPHYNKNLMDFRVGIIALMTGNLFAVGLFFALSKERFFIFSVLTMVMLGLIMGSASRRHEVTTLHYAAAFALCYFYGLIMFCQGDNTKGVMLFGLVYPVLSIYILKTFWGNLLIVLELITCLLSDYYINPLKMGDCTRSIFICIYIMFWVFGISMEEAKSFLERRMLEQQERLAFYADYDQLTKLYNRRKFYEKIEELYPKEYIKGNHKMALMIMDLDSFKRINDTYGHNVGDIVLAETAQRIINSTRSTDLCCRWGGEEFIVLAQVNDDEAGQLLAQKICDSVGKRKYAIDGERELYVTLSIGLIMTNRFDELELTNLIHYADNNLYRAKKNGKNQVIYSRV